MAQILKDDMRERIIKAAKEEFLQYGYDDASMRRIAKNSGMTVGNLYRYFKSKEDINLSIVGDTYNLIDKVVQKLTDGKLSVTASVFGVKYDIDHLTGMLDECADEMVDIYESHKTEFNILMLKSKLNDELTDWFSKLIVNLILTNYPVKGFDHEMELLSRSYAVSIFSGLKELFRISDVEPELLKSLVKIYFRSFVYMLDNDIRRFIGA